MTLSRITWPELAQRYRESVTGQTQHSTPVLRRRQRTMQDGSEDHWMGANYKEILHRLDHGYQFSEMDESVLPHAVTEENRWYYTDDSSDAEYQYDLDLMGETDYYLAKRRVESKAGITLNIGFSFRAMVNARTIEQYGIWVGSLVQALQANGYDMEIVVFNYVDNLIRGEGNTRIEVVVSKFGELKLTSDWAPLFSPGGYRHLNFFARALLEEQGKRLNDMGGSLSTDYKVDWNAEERILTVDSNSSGNNFNAELMTQKLAQVQEQLH